MLQARGFLTTTMGLLNTHVGRDRGQGLLISKSLVRDLDTRSTNITRSHRKSQSPPPSASRSERHAIALPTRRTVLNIFKSLYITSQ